MTITGVMWPWAGRGISASFTARKLSDDADVTTGLSYQWYRVNPLSDDMIPVSGATSLTYITTEADAGGWKLLCKATGNGTAAGGFRQVRTFGALISNNSSVTNLTASGFHLKLCKSVPALTGLAVVKNGVNRGDFIVTDPAKTSVAPGASTTFKVTFKPGAKRTRNAAIHIKSNDPDESPFDISLTGLGAKP